MEVLPIECYKCGKNVKDEEGPINCFFCEKRLCLTCNKLCYVYDPTSDRRARINGRNVTISTFDFCITCLNKWESICPFQELPQYRILLPPEYSYLEYWVVRKALNLSTIFKRVFRIGPLDLYPDISNEEENFFVEEEEVKKQE